MPCGRDDTQPRAALASWEPLRRALPQVSPKLTSQLAPGCGSGVRGKAAARIHSTSPDSQAAFRALTNRRARHSPRKCEQVRLAWCFLRGPALAALRKVSRVRVQTDCSSTFAPGLCSYTLPGLARRSPKTHDALLPPAPLHTVAAPPWLPRAL